MSPLTAQFSGTCHLRSQPGKQPAEPREPRPAWRSLPSPPGPASSTHLRARPAAGPVASVSPGAHNRLPSLSRRVRGVGAAAPRGSSLPRGGGAGHSLSQTPTGAARSTWRRARVEKSHGAPRGPSCICRALDTDLCPQKPKHAEEEEGLGGLPADDRGLLPRPVDNLVGDAGVCDVIGGPDAQRFVPGHDAPKTPTGTGGAHEGPQA